MQYSQGQERVPTCIDATSNCTQTVAQTAKQWYHIDVSQRMEGGQLGKQQHHYPKKSDELVQLCPARGIVYSVYKLCNQVLVIITFYT